VEEGALVLINILAGLAVIACAWVAYVRHLDKKEAARRDREAMVRIANFQLQQDARRRAEGFRNVIVMPPADHPIWKRKVH